MRPLNTRAGTANQEIPLIRIKDSAQNMRKVLAILQKGELTKARPIATLRHLSNSPQKQMNAVNRSPVADPSMSAVPLKIGSEEHKQAFCRMLLDTFNPYKPAIIEWPELAPDALARVTGLPFWTIAVETEDRASAHIGLMAEQTKDPLMREALTLMAFEESRHRKVLDALVARYGIKLDPLPKYVPSNRIEWNFMSTGYGECLDSFFAFGLFELARQSGYFPPELVETFEPVIAEEARHIIFFVNWAAYTQANTPLLAKPWFAAKRLAHLALNGLSRVGIAGDQDDFATTGKEAVGVDIELAQFMDLCLSENERRMSVVDGRLLRPMIMPRAVKAARFFIR